MIKEVAKNPERTPGIQARLKSQAGAMERLAQCALNNLFSKRSGIDIFEETIVDFASDGSKTKTKEAIREEFQKLNRKNMDV